MGGRGHSGHGSPRLGPAGLGGRSTAYAEVATAVYAIGTPTNAVAGVVASPATISQGGPILFVVKFRATAQLSGSGTG